MISLSEVHKTCLHQKKPFVSRRLPMGAEIQTSVQNIANASTTGFVFAPFTSSSKKVFINPDIQFEGREVSQDIFSNPLAKAWSLPEVDDLYFATKDEHKTLVANAIALMKQSDISKIVLSRIMRREIDDSFNPTETFLKLCDRYPNAFVYILYHPDCGLWMGATPEQLLKIEDGVLHTVSLAGTKVDETTEWTEKEIVEQQIVTDFIADTLKRNELTPEVSKAKTVKAGAVMHLKSEIRAEVNPKTDINSLLTDLHPTPAVCGMPKKEAMQFIVSNEPHNRTYYTGFLGELGTNNSANLYVNLRCMQICKNSLALYLGGGITEDSDLEAEWIETENKAQTLLSVIEG